MKINVKGLLGWVAVGAVALKAGYDKYAEQQGEKYMEELENRVQLLEKKVEGSNND